jgi:hypothetical protein
MSTLTESSRGRDYAPVRRHPQLTEGTYVNPCLADFDQSSSATFSTPQ